MKSLCLQTEGIIAGEHPARSALLSTYHQGILGHFRFKLHRDPTPPGGAVVMKLKHGRFVKLD